MCTNLRDVRDGVEMMTGCDVDVFVMIPTNHTSAGMLASAKYRASKCCSVVVSAVAMLVGVVPSARWYSWRGKPCVYIARWTDVVQNTGGHHT